MARRKTSQTPDVVKLLRRRRAPAWLVLLALLALLLARFFGQGEPPPVAPVDPSEAEQQYVIERVVDGDTLVLVGGERVRLIGVDTPETVHPRRPVEPLGPEASQFTKQMVEGKAVRLEFDKERRDRYGRLLAYVYVDGVMLNEELIRAGFSAAQLQYPYSNAMKRLFQNAEAEAREARRGLWGLDEGEQDNEPSTQEGERQRAA
jgi:micrococcal nuclease